jgi:hypothetical protein
MTALIAPLVGAFMGIASALLTNFIALTVQHYCWTRHWYQD